MSSRKDKEKQDQARASVPPQSHVQAQTQAPQTVEFSRLFQVDSLQEKPRKESLVASKKECAALARRFGLLELSGLSAVLSIRREAGTSGLIHVRGALKADAVQESVVSLEPVPQHVEAEFESFFSPHPVEARATSDADSDLPALEESESPEMIVDGAIDLGELVAQQLALALDPYPRREGEAVPAAYVDMRDEKEVREGALSPLAGKVNPFAALAALKDKTRSGD